MSFDIKMALGIVLCLNCIFFLSEIAIGYANPDADPDFFNYEDSMLSSYDGGNYTLIDIGASELPSTVSSVSVEGGFFTDAFKTMKEWLLSIPGMNYLVGIINAVPHFLYVLGMPVEVCFAIGFMWHVMSVFLVIAWLKG